MKYLKAAIPSIALLVAVAVIYFSSRKSLPLLVAGAIVIVASAAAIIIILRATLVAETIRPRLANLATSSLQWKEAVRMVVARVADSEGYAIHKTLVDAPNFEDPAGGRVFVFTKGASAPNGLLVLTPDDFAHLAMLSNRKLEKVIRRKLFGNWGSKRLSRHRDEIVQRIADTAARLYSLQFFGVASKVSIGPDVCGALQARIGTLDLEFGREELEQFLDMPLIQMNLKILEALGKKDPGIEGFVKGWSARRAPAVSEAPAPNYSNLKS
jgi:hypothetical protein